MEVLSAISPTIGSFYSGSSLLLPSSSSISSQRVSPARELRLRTVLQLPIIYQPEQLTPGSRCDYNAHQRCSAAAGTKRVEYDHRRKREQWISNSEVALDNPFVVRSHSNTTKNSSVSLFLKGAAIGLGSGLLFFCRPAHADNVVAPPTLTATLNDKGEVDVQESTPSETTSGELNDEKKVTEEKPGRNIRRAEELERPFEEGSDLANDPAEVLLNSYLEKHPTDKKALQALLFMRLKKGDLDASFSVLKTLIELEPENLEWKYIRAQAHEYAGDLPEARQGFEEILQSKPFSARALQGLVVVLHKAGEDEQALKVLMEAVQKAVDAGQAKEAINLRMLLGQLYTMQGNLEKAMELYRTVVEEDPKDYRPYLCQGLVYSIIGEEAEAEKHFRRYRKLCPKDFPHRGFLDEMMLKAKIESRKLNQQMKEEEELRSKGKKPPKAMRHPLASGPTPLKDNNSGSR